MGVISGISPEGHLHAPLFHFPLSFPLIVYLPNLSFLNLANLPTAAVGSEEHLAKHFLVLFWL